MKYFSFDFLIPFNSHDAVCLSDPDEMELLLTKRRGLGSVREGKTVRSAWWCWVGEHVF